MSPIPSNVSDKSFAAFSRLTANSGSVAPCVNAVNANTPATFNRLMPPFLTLSHPSCFFCASAVSVSFAPRFALSLSAASPFISSPATKSANGTAFFFSSASFLINAAMISASFPSLMLLSPPLSAVLISAFAEIVISGIAPCVPPPIKNVIFVDAVSLLQFIIIEPAASSITVTVDPVDIVIPYGASSRKEPLGSEKVLTGGSFGACAFSFFCSSAFGGSAALAAAPAAPPAVAAPPSEPLPEESD